MSSVLQAQAIPLGVLFSDPHLVEVPAFQRAFSWTQDEAGRLLEDILEALDADGAGGRADCFFLGPMLFLDSEPVSRVPWRRSVTERLLHVVDGLQRLVTLTILFCLLRDLDAAHDPSSARLLKAIGGGDGTRDNGGFRLRLGGRDGAFFVQHVQTVGSTRHMPAEEPIAPGQRRILEVREHFRSVLANENAVERRRLVDFLLERCFVAFISTTSIDGVHPIFVTLNTRGKPLAIQDILKALLLGESWAQRSDRCRELWEDAETRLGSDFDQFFSHVRAMHGRLDGKVISGIRRIAKESGGAHAFIENVLHPAALAYDDIRKAQHSGSPHSSAITASLTYLSWVPWRDWVPPAMLWWIKKQDDPAALAWFLKSLEQLSYGALLLVLRGSKRAHRFGTVVSAIRNGQDLTARNSPLTLSRDEQRMIRFNLRNLHERDSLACKLVLLRLNDALAGAPQGLSAHQFTVEHVLPRRPSSPWLASFPDPREREQYTESLGNLMLTTGAQNAEAANLDFTRKRTVLFSAPGTETLPINDYVRRQSRWGPDQIKEREALLIARLNALLKLGEEGRSEEMRSEQPERARSRHRRTA
jgi:hypothetical protein